VKTEQQSQLSARMRRLLSTRRGIITVAIAAAVLGGAILVLFLSAYRNSLTGADGTKKVMVAKALIDEGSPAQAIAENNMYELSSVDKADIEDGAIQDPDEIKGKITKRAIFPGEQVTSGDFRPQGDSLGDRIQARERAISLPFSAHGGLVGHLEDDDRVDVIGLFRLRPESAGVERPVSKILIQNALVLKAAKKPESGVSSDEDNAVVVRATDEEAADLAFAAEFGEIWLSLRPSAGAKQAARPSPTAVENLVFGLPPIPVRQFRRELGGRR
jgi:Flp pilus assembly protein CpaB